jgi:hypothetical protein
MVQLNLAMGRNCYRYVFVLSHMRSGSTLVSHILASHQDFAGAGETHITYSAPEDLPKLILRTCELLRKLRLPGTYVVDQINHPYVTDDVLSSPLIYKCIILIREPEATLKSLMAMFKWKEATALECYLGRLAQISHYGRILGDRAIFVEYDDLVDYTDETLSALTCFFEVGTPFSANYATHAATSKVGDRSSNISVGRIVRTRSHESKIGAEIVRAAFSAFSRCRQELLSAGVRSQRSDSLIRPSTSTNIS